MKLEIKGAAPNHREPKVILGRDPIVVLLDGTDITRCCRSVSFYAGAGSIVTATIDFMPDELIVDKDVLAVKKQASLPDVTQEALVNLLSDAIMRNINGIKTLLRNV